MDSYNFDKIGKKMPYSVPDTFFDDFENKIMAKAASRRKRHKVLKIVYQSIAVAASLALIVVAVSQYTMTRKTDFAEIDLAFDNLSEADQAYLIEIYQEDIFINE